MPDDVDGDLLARFVRGDQAAFEALFRQFERDVYGWIDPVTYTSVSALLLATAVLASYLSARRAIAVDPVQALRAE